MRALECLLRECRIHDANDTKKLINYTYQYIKKGITNCVTGEEAIQDSLDNIIYELEELKKEQEKKDNISKVRSKSGKRGAEKRWHTSTEEMAKEWQSHQFANSKSIAKENFAISKTMANGDFAIGKSIAKTPINDEVSVPEGSETMAKHGKSDGKTIAKGMANQWQNYDFANGKNDKSPLEAPVGPISNNTEDEGAVINLENESLFELSEQETKEKDIKEKKEYINNINNTINGNIPPHPPKYKRDPKSVLLEMPYVEESFKDVVLDWLAYKKDRNECYKSPVGLKAMYNNLYKWSGGDPSVAREIIDRAMGNNWIGFKELQPTRTLNNFKNGNTGQYSEINLDDGRKREYISTI